MFPEKYPRLPVFSSHHISPPFLLDGHLFAGPSIKVELQISSTDDPSILPAGLSKRQDTAYNFFPEPGSFYLVELRTTILGVIQISSFDG